ncbi:MAG: endopeptidase La [Oscillospiraceae bacterium]
MAKKLYRLPLVALRGIVAFPGMVLHFDVGRPQSVAAIEEAMLRDKFVFLCYQNDILLEEPEADDLAEIGTVALIKQVLHLPDGNIRVLVEGVFRASFSNLDFENDFGEVDVVEKIEEAAKDEIQVQVLIRQVQHLMEDFLEIYDRLSPDAVSTLLAIDDPGEMADIVVSNLPLKPQSKQIILNESDVQTRLEKLIMLLTDELDVLEIEREIMDKVQDGLDKNQREYVLREKLRVIKEELGDDDGAKGDVKKYRETVAGRNLPSEVAEKLEEEFERLLKLPPQSQEYSVIQNYVETVLALPWEISDTETLDIKKAEKVLNHDHYGLEKVKERILEYIAVKKLNGGVNGTILCLVGPPGTGKTSIASSLAKALGRKYIRISLGGVQNESEIRGHRKTYVGSMPGRIVEGLKRAGSNNPLILFDEIDKMSKDYSGDPASAMLEVLDPEQNKSFRDHFLELPIDLSSVMFLTTANTLDTIPKPLIDRMDIVSVTGYDENEKLEIAKKYLLPKQRKLNGLLATNIKISDITLRDVITSYTRESGVRGLERKISALCRKVAKAIAADGVSTVTINKTNITEYLGSRIFTYDKVDNCDKIGSATGLAWTESGGETLFIEVNTMEGNGKLELTGNLGDVMKESAKTALSYVRANCLTLGIDKDFYKKTDIHIHVPEGAVPKDGPSAGITMATALTSALSGKSVKNDVAMTGEITLRGRVLPIGGLTEKTLAAYRMGIKKIIIPFENKSNYEELHKIIKDNIEFTFAKDMTNVLSVALTETTSEKIENPPVKNDVFHNLTVRS